MSSRRPGRLKTFDYIGKHRYFVTCSTARRRPLFSDATVVELAAEQILRTCRERQFDVIAYVFMEDHIHLLIVGTSDDSHFIKTMTLVRQRTAVAYSRVHENKLWQDGYFDRILRPSDDDCEFVRYIRENPSKKGLAEERTKFPYVWLRHL